MNNDPMEGTGQKRAFRKSEHGAALISVMAGVGLLTLTMYSSMAYLDLLAIQMSGLKRDFSINLVKNNIVRSLQSPSAWSNTVNDDSNLFKACQADPVNCLAVSNYVPLRIHDIENAVLVSGVQGSWYDYSGKVCTGESCPILVKSQWRGVCNSEGTCTQVYVDVDFQIRAKDGTHSKSKVGFLKNYFIGSAQKSLTTGVAFSGTVSNAIAKIVVILDSSESMVDNFAKVKKGLSGIMTKLAGKDVEVYFYTTAGLEPNGDTNIPAAIKDYYDNKSTGYIDHKKLASYVVTKDDAITYSSRLAMDMSRKIGLPIDPSLDTATIQSRLDSLFATYVAAYGTDRESGICTLHRVLTDDGPNKIIGTNDLAYFIIVSDEDDVMMSSAALNYNCHKTQKVEYITGTSSVTANCNIATEPCEWADLRVTLSGVFAYAYFTIKTNDTYTNATKTLCSLNTLNSAPGYDPCPFKTLGDFNCGAKELAAINPDGTKNIVACKYGVRQGSNSYGVTDTVPAHFPALQAYMCQGGGSFSVGTETYVSLQDLITKMVGNGFDSATITNCSASTYKTISVESTDYKTTSYTRMNGDVATNNLITFEEKLKMRDHIVATLKTKFGDTGFGVKAFIQDPVKDTGLCTLTDGSYGTAYKDLISSLYNNPYSGYESICNDNYDFSFETLGNTILTTINNTYIFNNLTSTDKITGVTITRSGSSFTLPVDKYEVIGAKVIFQDGVLQANDQITLILGTQSSGTW